MKAVWEKFIGKEVLVTLKDGEEFTGILQKNVIKRVEFLTLWALEEDVYALVAQFAASEVESILPA
jgi:hypothetical protein